MSEQGIAVLIPTYDPESQECDETKPARLTLCPGTGLRIVLGDPADPHAPDLLIERHADRWYIVVHPDNGDPLCLIEITQDWATVVDDVTGQTMLALPAGGWDGCGEPPSQRAVQTLGGER